MSTLARRFVFLLVLVGTLTILALGCDDESGSGALKSIIGDASIDQTVFGLDARAADGGTIPGDVKPDASLADATPPEGGAPPKFYVGGVVTGLGGAIGLVLQLNGGTDLKPPADGAFAFPTLLANGTDYDVTVSTQPAGRTCSVSAGKGTIAGATIVNIVVNCMPGTFTIGGTVTGLAKGAVLRVKNNGANEIVILANGAFALPIPLHPGDPYAVTVSAQPTAPVQVCTVAGGSGTMPAADVTSVAITCATTGFKVGGNVTGLAAGKSLVLQNNGGDDLTMNADGSFTFAKDVLSGQDYLVTIKTQPVAAGQTCSVAKGLGKVTTAAITDVTVTCTKPTFTIGGTLKGLGEGRSIVLQNKGIDDLKLNTNGEFTFAQTAFTGATYAIAVSTQPVAQVCTVTAGNGPVGTSNVASVVVQCVDSTFTIGGTVSGLSPLNGTIIISNGQEFVEVAKDGPFTLPGNFTSGTEFDVQTTSPEGPISQKCDVTGGQGVIGTTNVNVFVGCTTNAFTVGGQLNGLAPGDTAVLYLNGVEYDVMREGEAITTPFTFPNSILSGDQYTVTVDSPTAEFGQIRTVTQGETGTMGTTNVNDVIVSCFFAEICEKCICLDCF